MSKTEAERRQMLESIGLNPDAPALVAAPPTPKKAKHKAKADSNDEIVLAPPGVDPHTMPVEDIVFDPRLLDGYASLAFDQQGSEASRYIFALYKSAGRNKDRNGALQRKITSFITQTRRSRETGGMVREKVVASKEQRDIAAVLASAGMTAGELADMIRKQQEG